MKDLERVEAFIQQHHVMSLATTTSGELSVCSLFYTYDKKTSCFIVASSEETLHIQHILKDSSIAGNILLETKTVGDIKGLQFRGKFSFLEDQELKKHYFNDFPYVISLNPTLWKIKVNYFKLTDNSLGFGKKVILDFRN